jgi:hypothetical protein
MRRNAPCWKRPEDAGKPAAPTEPPAGPHTF